MKEIFERFDIYMKHRGLNDNQVTNQCGLSVGVIGKARRGRNDLGRESIKKILNIYKDINRIWLLTGEGTMLNEHSDNECCTEACERIDNILNYFNINAKLFSEQLGYDRPQIIYDIRNGKTKRISFDLANKISSVFPEINRVWLLTGEGQMLNEQSDSSDDEDLRPRINMDGSEGIPFYDVDFTMGFDILFNDQTAAPDYYVSLRPYNNCTCWISAHGDSMYPTIISGDMLALQKIEDLSCIIGGEIYAIVTRSGLRTIKRAYDGGETVRLVPDNKSYDEQLIPKEQIVAIYIVRGNIRHY